MLEQGEVAVVVDAVRSCNLTDSPNSFRPLRLSNCLSDLSCSRSIEWYDTITRWAWWITRYFSKGPFILPLCQTPNTDVAFVTALGRCSNKCWHGRLVPLTSRGRVVCVRSARHFPQCYCMFYSTYYTCCTRLGPLMRDSLTYANMNK